MASQEFQKLYNNTTQNQRQIIGNAILMINSKNNQIPAIINLLDQMDRISVTTITASSLLSLASKVVSLSSLIITLY